MHAFTIVLEAFRELFQRSLSSGGPTGAAAADHIVIRLSSPERPPRRFVLSAESQTATGPMVRHRRAVHRGPMDIADRSNPNDARTDPPDPPRLPPRWVIRTAWRIHRGLYRLTRGRIGLRRPNDDTYGLMRVTTIGRRSGLERSVMLAYYEHEVGLVTLAMNGWGADEPAWWRNAQLDPDVQVVLRDRTQPMRVREALGDERDRLWAWWRDRDPRLDEWASLRPRPTAVVVLEPR